MPDVTRTTYFCSTLTRAMEVMSMQQEAVVPPTSQPASPAAVAYPSPKSPVADTFHETPQARPPGQVALDLPPPDSDEWQAMELPPAPPQPPAPAPTPKRTSKR